MKALVISGDVTIQTRLIDLLSARGHDFACQTKLDLGALAVSDDTSLVVLELVTWGRDVETFCRLLRARPDGRWTLLAGLVDDSALMTAAAAAGFDSILVKGEPPDLFAARFAFVEHQAARRAESRCVEAALTAERDLLQSIIDHIPDLLYVKDTASRFTRINRETARYLALNDPADAIGKSDGDFFPPHLATRFRADEERVMTTGRPILNKLEPRSDDPEDGGWFQTSTAPVNDRDGRVTGIIGLARDVTEQRRVEARIAAAEARYRALVEQVPAITYSSELVDGRDCFTYISPQVEAILGYGTEEFLAIWNDPASIELVHPNDRAQFLAALNVANGELQSYHCEYRHRRRDGSWVWLRSDAAPLPAEPGQPTVWHGVAFDLTEQKAAEARYRALVEQIPAVTYVTEHIDGVERFLYVSPQVTASLGFSPTDYLVQANADWSHLVHPDDRERVMTAHARSATSGAPFRTEYRHRTADDGWVWMRDDARLLPAEASDHGGSQRWQGILIDLSEQKAMEAQLEHQAYHDPLTGLPNRALLTERLEHALARGRRQATGVAVLFLDLDGFKVVNDSLGHETGDLLLCAVASRLTSMVREVDTVARLGGDEFTILIEDVADPSEPLIVAHRIVDGFARPFVVAGRDVYATSSIGIALGEPGRSQPLDLLRDADVAMYQAKRLGKGTVRLFDPTLNAQAAKRLMLEQDLRRAVDRGEFEVYYQPVVSVATGAPVKVEALVRWRHPERGLVSPADFIPLAEEMGLILPMGRWVLSEACRQARTWQDELGLDPPLTVSVNLSVRQFQHPELADDVDRALTTAGLAPECLQLEITESVLIDVDSALATMGRLRSMGVRLALDDFGTGYSSLSHLKRLPVGEVKIDRSFVQSLANDAQDRMIVQAIVSLGRMLRMEVAGEGVETPAQLEQLRRLRFGLAQGNLFARPQPAAETGEALRSLAAEAGGGTAVGAPHGLLIGA